MPKDLHSLPKVRDSISFLYLEKAVIEQDALSIVAIQGESRIPIPVAAMTVLMLGPGISITHSAVKTISDCGCMVVWCGENASRFYAYGQGETRSAENLLLQAKACMDPELHMQVVYRMYARRFPDMDTSGMSLQQVRGLEGIRVREAYKLASKSTGVKWSKRNYKSDDWDDADPINRALSYANTLLYSVCQAAIMSLGYSTGLGFIHTGKMLSFVYDIADLYKATTSIPAAFESVAVCSADLKQQVRRCFRSKLHSQKVMQRIADDIAYVMGTKENTEARTVSVACELWDGGNKTVTGGKGYYWEEDPDW